MKNVNLQVRINEELKQEVAAILKEKGLSYTSMLDALFRQIIEERRIPFAIELPTPPIVEDPSTANASPQSTLDDNGYYTRPQTTLKASESRSTYGQAINSINTINFDSLDKSGVLNIRINNKVKTLVTSILKEMGLTISLTITLVSKQIALLKTLPTTINTPPSVDRFNEDFWTTKELENYVKRSEEESKNRELIPLDTVFEELLQHQK